VFPIFLPLIRPTWAALITAERVTPRNFAASVTLTMSSIGTRSSTRPAPRLTQEPRSYGLKGVSSLTLSDYPP
jgi:hypothetical protein